MRRRGLLLLAMVLAIGAAVAVAWHAIATAPPAPAVAAAGTASGQSRLQGLGEAKSRAAQSRQPVPAVETFTDAELSSMANEQARALGLPLSHLVLHSTGRGTLQGDAMVRLVGQDVPVSLEVVPSVTDGTRLTLTVTSVRAGAVPLPGPLADQVSEVVRRSLEVGLVPSGFRDVNVRVTSGQITITGVATPGG